MFLFFQHQLSTISFAESIIVQGFHIYIPTLDKTTYMLTTHGRFDDVMVRLYLVKHLTSLKISTDYILKYFFPEKMIGHIIKTVSLGDSLHEMSDPVPWEK